MHEEILEKVRAWNDEQSDIKNQISSSSEFFITGLHFFPEINPAESVKRNDRINFEKNGPVTGLRIWRSNAYIHSLQFKYGNEWGKKWGDENVRKMLPDLLALNSRRVFLFEVELKDNEFISKI